MLLNVNDIVGFEEYLINKKSFFTVECLSLTGVIFTLEKDVFSLFNFFYFTLY